MHIYCYSGLKINVTQWLVMVGFGDWLRRGCCNKTLQAVGHWIAHSGQIYTWICGIWVHLHQSCLSDQIMHFCCPIQSKGRYHWNSGSRLVHCPWLWHSKLRNIQKYWSTYLCTFILGISLYFHQSLYDFHATQNIKHRRTMMSCMKLPFLQVKASTLSDSSRH